MGWPFDLPASPADLSPTLPLSAADPAARCELVDGTPIHPRWVLGLLGVATLRRLVLGADSEILDLGREVRTFPRKLKDAIFGAHRGTCANDGCDAPFSWLQADHVIPWTRNGPTATDNGQPLCRPDNNVKGNRVA